MRLTQSFRQQERWRNDPEYRERQQRLQRKHYHKHRKRYLEYYRKYYKELSEWKDKHCKLCGKLLNHRTKGNYCKECFWSNPKALRGRR